MSLNVLYECQACGPPGVALDGAACIGVKAGVVKLVDTPDLGSGGASHGGSSPSARTIVCLLFDL